MTDYNADAASFQRWLRNHGHAATAELRGGTLRNEALDAALRLAFNAGGQDRAQLRDQLRELARATLDVQSECLPSAEPAMRLARAALAEAALAGEVVTT